MISGGGFIIIKGGIVVVFHFSVIPLSLEFHSERNGGQGAGTKAVEINTQNANGTQRGKEERNVRSICTCVGFNANKGQTTWTLNSSSYGSREQSNPEDQTTPGHLLLLLRPQQLLRWVVNGGICGVGFAKQFKCPRCLHLCIKIRIISCLWPILGRRAVCNCHGVKVCWGFRC